jgi:hypothetical protein
MLKTLKVYRYRSSGKLILGLGNGSVLSLNSDLSFSGRGTHKVGRATSIEETSYRIEVEVTVKGGQENFQMIRKWDERHLPAKANDPNTPLENRIDISPSQEFSETEKKYVGQSAGDTFGYVLIVGTLFLFLMAGVWGWWPPLISFISGIIIVRRTSSSGDVFKISEVTKAKERLRREAEILRSNAMRDVRVWAELDGVQFERAISLIYKEQGFEVQFTPRTNDQGVDLILKKNGKVSIVQCKAYTKNVGVSAIRELVGVRASWPDAEEAILASLYDFSKQAKIFAAEHNIKLFSVAKDYLKTDYRLGK